MTAFVAIGVVVVEIDPLRELLFQYEGVLGVVVGFAASQLVQVWRDRTAERRSIAAERRADERARRDAKLARVRDACQTVLTAAWGPQSARVQMIVGDREDSRTRIEAILAETGVGINQANSRLALEDDTQDVRDLFRQICLAFDNYAVACDRPAD